VALHVAVVQAEGEFLNIPIKVLRAGVMVDTMQTTLEHCPYAFDAIRADSRPSILSCRGFTMS
jgi:hypothetical protein